MPYRVYFLIAVVILFGACNSEPVPIEYGFDHCHFCEMTIVDKSHAAIVVSSKGKTFKFDAVECMINYSNRDDSPQFTTVLVANYLNPGEMIPAINAHFIISDSIPSPMGANLSAVVSESDAILLQKEKSGEIFNWQLINERFK